MPCRKYIYIHATLQQKIYSYTYFPPNLVQKACLQALASSCKHYHSKSRIQGFRFKIQKEPFESRREDSRFKIFSVFPWIQGLDTRFKIQDLKRTSWIQRVDSRFKIFTGFSWIQGLGHKIQDSRSKKNFLNPAGGFKIQDFQWLSLNPGAWIQDWRFKIQKEFLESKEVDSRFSIFRCFS